MQAHAILLHGCLYVLHGCLHEHAAFSMPTLTDLPRKTKRGGFAIGSHTLPLKKTSPSAQIPKQRGPAAKSFHTQVSLTQQDKINVRPSCQQAWTKMSKTMSENGLSKGPQLQRY
eukprot:1142759-Pelagomonas_calceolata.AAC.1